MIVQLLTHRWAEETEAGQGPQPIDVQPAVGAADDLMDALSPGPGEARGAAEAEEGTAHQLAEAQPGGAVERAEDAVELVPGVASQPLVGPLAGEGDLVTLAVDLG